jgi:hypothetical protein
MSCVDFNQVLPSAQSVERGRIRSWRCLPTYLERSILTGIAIAYGYEQPNDQQFSEYFETVLSL